MKIAFIDYTLGGTTSTFLFRELLELQASGVPFEVFTHQNPHPDSRNERFDELHRPVHRLRPIRPLSRLGSILATFARHPQRSFRLLISALILPVPPGRGRMRTVAHLITAFGWARKFRTGGFGRVHSLWASGPGSSAYFLSRLFDVPFSFSCHATDLFVDHLFLEEKVRHADRIVTCTDFNRRYLLETFPHLATDKVHLCHHGLPLERLDSILSNSPRAPATDAKQLLAVGQLRTKKGYPQLLSAFSLLLERGQDLRLTIVGEGPLRHDLEARIESLGLSDRVELLGARPFSKVVECLGDADLFVMSSVQTADNDRDGIPNVILEAMACGVPVVATRVSGIPEVVAHGLTGLLAEPDDPPSLSEQIEEALAHPEATMKRVERAKNLVKERFDLHSTAIHLRKTLLSLTPPPPPRKPRVCFVAPNLGKLLWSTKEDPFAGGSEVQQLLLGRELSANGWDVRFVVRGEEPEAGIPRVARFETMLLFEAAPRSRRNQRRPWHALHPHGTSFYQAMKRADADVYWTRGAKVETSLVAWFCRSHDRRYVHALAHDNDCAAQTATGLRGPLRRLLYTWALKRANRILAQTQQQIELMKNGLGMPASVSPNVMPAPPEARSRKEPSPTILWVGALSPHKRPHVLLDLAESMPGSRFRLIGFGKRSDASSFAYAEKIRRRAEAMDNVEFLGFVPFLEMDPYYAAATVLVNTSEKEGYPNVHLQAYRHGVPVVTCCDPDGVVKKLDLGRVVSTGNEDLRHAVSELLQDKERLASMGDRARRYVQEEHGSPRVLPGILDLLADIAESQANARGFRLPAPFPLPPEAPNTRKLQNRREKTERSDPCAASSGS